MELTYPNRAELSTKISEACTQFAGLLRSLEPEMTNKTLPHMDWTVGETAAHVLTVIRRGLSDMRRSSSPAETATLNQTCLEETTERDLIKLAEMLEKDTYKVLNFAFPKLPDNLVFPFHAGAKTTVIPAMAVILGEFLIHGYDIAQATKSDWQIEPYSATLVLHGISSLLPAWYKVGSTVNNETWQLNLEGQTLALTLQFSNDKMTVTTGQIANHDYTIETDPVNLLLMLGYKRKPAHNPLIDRLNEKFELL